MNKEQFNHSLEEIDLPMDQLMKREKIAMSLGKKKRTFGRTTTRSILVACSLCIALFGSGFISTGIANALTNLPVIGHTLEEYVYSNGRSIADYKTVIGKSVENKGIEVTLNEVILDEDQLLISSTFHTELTDPDQAYNWFPEIRVFINGKETPGGGGGGPAKITDSQIDYVWEADVPNINLADKQKIKIVFQDLERSDSEKVIKGKWSFTFTASGEKLMESRESLPIGQEIKLDNHQSASIDEMIFTPISTQINFTQEANAIDLNFRLEDQNGKEIQWRSAQTMGGENHTRFVALDPDVTKLKVIPYVTVEEHIVDSETSEVIKGETVSEATTVIQNAEDAPHMYERILHDQIFEVDVK